MNSDVTRGTKIISNVHLIITDHALNFKDLFHALFHGFAHRTIHYFWHFI